MDSQDAYQLQFSAENGKNYETPRGQLKTPDNIAILKSDNLFFWNCTQTDQVFYEET